MTRQRLITAALLLLPFIASAAEGGALQRVGQAAGPFHLVILHLPIGLLAAVFLLDLLSLLPSRREALSQASLTLQWIGAPMAIAAAATGFLLSKSGDYTSSALMERHMWLGIGVAIVWFAMVAVRQAANSNPTVTRYLVYTLLLLSNGALTLLASHDGGTLVHGEGFLTKNLPVRLKSALCLDCKDTKTVEVVEAAAAAPTGPVTVYQAIVAPIMEANCTECHGPKKVKGDLRLDSPETIQKGGEKGAVITAGDPAKSSLHSRTVLPHDHDDIMPPGKKTKLTADQAKLLEWWIKQGASFDALYDKSALPAELQAVVDTAIPAKVAATPVADKAPPPPAKPDPAVVLAGAISEIEKTGGSAVWTATGSGELQVDFRGAPDSATDALIPLLTPVRDHLVSLTLSRGKITPAAIPGLAGFPKLARLAVDNTAVDDASLDTLTALPALESLNLVGTGITDAGAAKLAGAKTLKKVFLWQSKVTTNGFATLRKARPDLTVDDGWQPEDDAKPVAEGEAPATIAAAAAAAGPKTTYSFVVAPILEKNCVGCHGAGKAKGDLRLHTPDAIKAGGKGGPVVVAGDLAKSHLHARVVLPHDHADIMPPDKKEKLSPADIKRIAWWIQDGAAFDKPYDEKTVPADIKPAA